MQLIQTSSRNAANGASQRSHSGMTLRALEIFVAVAEESTMSAAATRLNMSQAAVSQAVIALEESLGVQLFDRSKRPPVPTLQGRSILQHAVDITSRVHKLEDAVRFSGSGAVPLLRIGMLNSLAATVGASFLHQLRDVALEWTVASGFDANGIRALLERRSDVVVTSDETPPPADIAIFPICSEPFVLALPASFNYRFGKIERLAEKLDFIRYGHNTHMGPKILSYLDSIGTVPPQRYQFDTTDAALHMVAGGFGWTIVTPIILLKSMIGRDAIRVVPLPQAALDRKIVVAVRRGEGLAIAKRVRSAAQKALRESVLPRIAALVPGIAKPIRLNKR